MRRRIAAILVTAALAGAAPAAAAAPEQDVFPLTGLPLECDAVGTIVFTSGELVGKVHEHEGQRGGNQLVFSYRLRDARLIDERGKTLTAVGSASNSSVYPQTDGEGPVEVGTFVANFTLLGSGGRQGAVHVLVRATREGIVQIDRGDCRIAW